MGVESSKPTTKRRQSRQEIMKVLTANENAHIRDLYNSIEEPKMANLKELWTGYLDPHLEELVINYLSKSRKKTTVAFRDFELLFAAWARGTADDKCDILIDMLTNFQRTEPIPLTAVLQYLESLINSFILLHSNSGWRDSSPAEVKCLSETLCADLPSDVTHEDLCMWIRATPHLSAVQASVVGRLYILRTVNQRAVPTRDCKHINSIMDVSSVMYLSAALPAALRDEWRILFSSASHGESFSKLMGLIVNQGPTVLIIKNKKGYVFGGFAPHSWVFGPNYFGDETSFLFRLKPNMAIYSSTHYNDHYQYVNVNQQTIPNGLGMGGQFGYWGLWLDAEFGSGQTSETCSTYRNCKLLSGAKNFTIDHLEVWAIGPVADIGSVTSGRSILDGNSEAQAMMDMVGKEAHSRGYREPVEEDY